MNSTETQSAETQSTAPGNGDRGAGDATSALLVVEKEEAGSEAGATAGGDSERLIEPPLSTLPVQMDVCIPLPSFRVADLIALEPGRVLTSEWGSTDDLPLWCGDVQLVWTEFEVVDQKIAVRVTRLV